MRMTPSQIELETEGDKDKERKMINLPADPLT